jgi:hypothetical protein
MGTSYGDSQRTNEPEETYNECGRRAETSQNQGVRNSPEAQLEAFLKTFGKKGDWKELI